MRISASIVVRGWQKHPIAWSVFGLVVAMYACFVIAITAGNGIGELGNALLIPVPLAIFFFVMSAFPFWAVNYPIAGWVVFIGEFVLILAWAVVRVRRRYRPRALLWGFLVLAATNLTLNFTFPNWAD